uniref:GTP-binding protein RAD n=1 Tax=Cacopsylla melanoneura TaxID=428564 RepID=A0A8D9ETG0_9HEMI
MAVLLQRSGPPPVPGTHSAPGSPTPSLSSFTSHGSSTDLITTASSALKRLHFKSAGAYRNRNKGQNVPRVVVMGSNSNSISTESGTTANNTSTDSSNTITTMITVTDVGDAALIDYKDIMNNHTPQSSLEKEEEFYSASSNEEQPKPSEDVKLIFSGDEIAAQDYENEENPWSLLQHTSIPKRNQEVSIVEEFNLPVVKNPDTSLEWYNIKMRQTSIESSKKNNTINTRKRLKLLSKRYARSNYEEERSHGRGSSGFAAEQMTVDSEDSFTMQDVSPPIPTSPTQNKTPSTPPSPNLISPKKNKQVFTFNVPTTTQNIPRVSFSDKGDIIISPSPNSEANKLSLATSKKLKVETTPPSRKTSMTSTLHLEQGSLVINKGATIFVQQPSISGNSPDKNEAENDTKQLLDVTNTFTMQQIHDFEMKYGSPHHNRSQSVKTPGSKSTVQMGPNGVTRHRPNFLSLPQQRSRVASMPNTGIEEEYYRLRHFSIQGKSIVNRGDSLKSRRSKSNNSVASSNSSVFTLCYSTEHLTTQGTVGTTAGMGGGSYPGSNKSSAATSLASSRESSCASCPGITAPYRVLMLGAAGVGKSSLISQFMTSEYLHAYDTSIDDEFGEKSVSVLLDGEESELTFIDHQFAEMPPDECIATYETPHGFIIVYSTIDLGSFHVAEQCLQALWKKDSIRSKAVILVANKTDLVRCRVVTDEDGKDMATAYDCKFIETSVGINHNVDELLVGILTQIRLKLDNPPEPALTNREHFSCRRKRSKSPGGFRKLRGHRTSASLKVKGLLSKVWQRDSKSKSCQNLHVL